MELSVRRGWLMPALGAVAWLVSGCDGSTPNAAPTQPVDKGIFGSGGGVPGVVEAVPLGGSTNAALAGAGGAAPDDGCQRTPAGTLALIDGFDDGDSVAAFEAGREAFWFTVHDESAGTLEPPNSFLPVAGGYRGTPAAHVSARNFTTWGAELAANLSYKQAIRCPYDASAFAGLRFVARGSGRVRVQLAMPGVVDKEYGGTCDPAAAQICYDDHGSFVALGEEWRVYELPWSSFLQRGYGTQVTFNPKTIHSLHFTMETPELPVDLWLDDVAFWDGIPASSGGSGAGGSGGSGAGGSGGTGAGGGGGGSAGSTGGSGGTTAGGGSAGTSGGSAGATGGAGASGANGGGGSAGSSAGAGEGGQIPGVAGTGGAG